jgi:hypothetical protein
MMVELRLVPMESLTLQYIRITVYGSEPQVHAFQADIECGWFAIIAENLE